MNKEFKISDLFTWKNGNTDLKKEHINGKGYPVVSSGLENAGIIGNTDVDARILPANTITIDMFGNVFYRDFEYKEVTHARVFTLIPNGFLLNDETGLYIVSSLGWLSKIFSYNNMCTYAKIFNTKISLPVIESDDPAHIYTPDDIDWQYMNDYIQEIKKRYEMRIIKQNRQMLEEYKKLADCTECETDGEAPAGFAIFRIGDIFDVRHIRGGTHTKKANLVPGDYRYVTGTSQNNGNASIRCGNTDRLDKGNCITVSETGGGPFYQPFDFVGYGPITVLRREGLGEQQYLYVCACMSRQNVRYGFNQGRTGRSIRKEEIALPVKEIKENYTPDDIDWDYMGRHIAAMELRTVQTVADMQKKEEQNIHTLVHDDK